jgi:hypothetical protein
MKKILFTLFTIAAFTFVSLSVPAKASADTFTDCIQACPQDVDAVSAAQRQACVMSCQQNNPAGQGAAQSNSVFGKVDAPPGVVDFNNSSAAGGSNIGLIVFISNIIKLATVIAGIWVLFNFITAGFTYITSQGESKAATQVKDQITNSVSGLVFIIGAYTVIALISYFLFGKADYILNPTLVGPK